MPPRYLLDENLRGPLWRACRQHNSRGQMPIDIVRVGDAACPALGSLDPEVLVWAEGAGRIVVTFDKSSLAAHLADHLRSGHHSPGIFTVRRLSSVARVVDFLVAAAYASEDYEWQDRIEFIG